MLKTVVPEDLVTGAQPVNVDQALKLNIANEAQYMALSATHVVTAIGNKVHIYAAADSAGLTMQPSITRELRGHIMGLRANRNFYAALSDGCAHVFPIEESDDSVNMVVPLNATNCKVSALSMAGEFLILGSQQGHIQHYVLDETSPAVEFRHERGIKELFPNVRGTRVVFVDDERKGYAWDPIDEICEEIPGFPSRFAHSYVHPT
jgi:WD repeat-containing protein 19